MGVAGACLGEAVARTRRGGSHGKLDACDVVIASMPEGEDDINRSGRGVQYWRAVELAHVHRYGVAVVHELEASRQPALPEFWAAYFDKLGRHSQGKRCVAVLTQTDGTVREAQRLEILQLAACDGAPVPGLGQRPDFRRCWMVALTHDEFEGWCRLSKPQPPCLELLGRAAPATGAMHCLPSAELAELRLRRLAAGHPATGALAGRLAVGGRHAVALAAGGELCQWGGADIGQRDGLPAEPPPGEGWVVVAAGNCHTVALASGGSLHQWGGSDVGQRDGLPRHPPLGERWVAVAAGAHHAVALASGGSLRQWGNGEGGQRQGLPHAPPPGEHWVSVAAGGCHTVALASDGSLWQWGGGDNGQRDGLPESPPPGERWVAVAAGAFHTVALADGGYLCQWGREEDGQREGLPEAPPRGERWVAVAAGTFHSVALASDGSLHQWGPSGEGQCEDMPAAPPPAERWVAVAAGAHHTVALASGGGLRQWGRSTGGQRDGLPDRWL